MIGFIGEMKILFNDTIRVDNFNYTDLNSSCVDIMIESQRTGINRTVRNWELISIDFYNLMTF